MFGGSGLRGSECRVQGVEIKGFRGLVLRGLGCLGVPG